MSMPSACLPARNVIQVEDALYVEGDIGAAFDRGQVAFRIRTLA